MDPGIGQHGRQVVLILEIVFVPECEIGIGPDVVIAEPVGQQDRLDLWITGQGHLFRP